MSFHERIPNCDIDYEKAPSDVVMKLALKKQVLDHFGYPPYPDVENMDPAEARELLMTIVINYHMIMAITTCQCERAIKDLTMLKDKDFHVDDGEEEEESSSSKPKSKKKSRR